MTSSEPKEAKAARLNKIIDGLKRVYPDAHCELNHSNALELLIATILSAQCTDKRVNLVTPDLFRKYGSAADYAGAQLAELEQDIKTAGFFRNKAKSIKACCQALVEEHGGQVPRTMEALTALGGVGRKTANVVLGNAFDISCGVVVDTHVGRLTQRFGLTGENDPQKIERELMELVPRAQWTMFSHWLIWHGRRRCYARNPDCPNCEISALCPRIGMHTWYLLESEPGHHAFNMALDEALLLAMPRLGRPVLRFYGWTVRAASFGYFQRYADIEGMTLLRPLVRRPTGGGLVPHDADWTYSLAFPPGEGWYSLSATESYRAVHEWIQAAFAKLDIATDLAAACRKAQAGQCFAGHEKFDLLWQGRKIAGAAQRRTREGLLIQGSVQPPPLALAQADWQEAMCEAARTRDGTGWLKFEPDAGLSERAQELVRQKYSQASYNQKR